MGPHPTGVAMLDAFPESGQRLKKSAAQGRRSGKADSVVNSKVRSTKSSVFLRSRYCSNHVNPKRSCPLREDLTDSTSCSVVQDGISFVELNGFLQQVTCCPSLEQAAGCLVVCYSIGNYGEAILRIETHRRVRAERIGVGDPVPNLHQRHVRANRFAAS